MALRPKELPAWATRPYAGYDLRWDEAVRQCRTALFAWARRGDPGTYSELVPLVGAIEWEEGAFTHGGRQIGTLLGQVSIEELDIEEDRPVLSALVYGIEWGMPSGGFWEFLDELGVQVQRTDDARRRFWNEEVKRCVAYFGQPRD